MTRSSKILAVAFALAALTLWSTPAQAQCGVTTPFGNFFGTVADCDDSGPVTGSIQAIDGNGLVVATIDNSFICRSSQDPLCGGTNAGDVGDGRIAFTGDWANQNVLGCPTDAGGTADGRNFYNITDASGQTLLFSVGRDPLAGYAADNAWPADSSGQILSNLACSSPREGTVVNAITQSEIAGFGIVSNVVLTCGDPVIRSDCDPDSRGTVLDRGSCTTTDPAFLASLQALNLYSTIADCTGVNLNYAIGRGGWGPVAGATNNGGGNWSAQIVTPFGQAGCTFLGCSYGNEQAPTSGNCSGNGASCTADTDCSSICNGGTNDGLACTDNSNCLGGCSLLAGLSCADDPGCLGDFGTCTNPAPGSCAADACIFGDPVQTEYPNVSSAVAIGGDTAPSPVALNVAAGFDKGRAFIGWTTDTEVGVAAFQIERIGRGGRVDVIRQVSPNGQASSYREVFNPGELRKGGAKSVQIRTLLTGGGEILSDPASF